MEKVRQFVFKNLEDLNTRVFEVFSSFRADFARALKEEQVVELKTVNGKDVGLDLIVLASQIFNIENEKLGLKKAIFVIPLEKEDNKYRGSTKDLELTGKKQKFVCFRLKVLTEEQAEIEKIPLPSKLQKRLVKKADKTQAEPASDKSQAEPTSDNKSEASDDLLFAVSDLICARFKVDNQMRLKIESEIASLLERYSIQKK